MSVSGVCASAATDLGTETRFCCWWEETCQRFAPDRVILERTSVFGVCVCVCVFFIFFSVGGQSAAQRTRMRIAFIILVNLINFCSIIDKQTAVVALIVPRRVFIRVHFL